MEYLGVRYKTFQNEIEKQFLVKQLSKAYLELHFAVFLFGFTAILGELISLNSFTLVWWRLFITCTSLIIFFNILKHLQNFSAKLIVQMAAVGFLVALHWVLFFASIKTSNASITLICLSTSSFLTAIIEPFVSKRKHSKLDLFLGMIIVPAMIMIVRNVDVSMHQGIILGLLSAFAAVLFSIWNKQIVGEVNAYAMTFVELGFGFIFLSGFIFFKDGFSHFHSHNLPNQSDWIYLIILAVVCTSIGYSLSINALKQLTAYASNLAINLEPVYGILLAAILLKQHEELNTNFYIGGLIIVMAVLSYPIARRIQKKKSKYG